MARPPCCDGRFLLILVLGLFPALSGFQDQADPHSLAMTEAETRGRFKGVADGMPQVENGSPVFFVGVDLDHLEFDGNRLADDLFQKRHLQGWFVNGRPARCESAGCWKVDLWLIAASIRLIWLVGGSVPRWSGSADSAVGSRTMSPPIMSNLHMGHACGAHPMVEMSFSYNATSREPRSHFQYELIGTDGVIRYNREEHSFELRNSHGTQWLAWHPEKNFAGMYPEFAHALSRGQARNMPTARDGLLATRIARQATEEAIRG